jgi:hypothetical protein
MSLARKWVLVSAFVVGSIVSFHTVSPSQAAGPSVGGQLSLVTPACADPASDPQPTNCPGCVCVKCNLHTGCTLCNR